MLEALHIENIAVIASLDVDFTTGLCVITGETGAGKSVMLDALGFLLGGKAKRDLLRSGCEEGCVSAVFSNVGGDLLAYLADAGFSASDELLLQRTLFADGKSKCRLNGRVIPQAILRELSAMLVNIHGQNDNQRLMLPAAQQSILDSAALDEEALAAYRAAFTAWRDTTEQLKTLRRDAKEAARLSDILRFQAKEIDDAKLKVGEEEELLVRRAKLQNAEKIAKQTEFSYRVLHGAEKGAATMLLERAAQAMQQLSSVIPEASEAAQKLMGMRYEVEDIAYTARAWGEDADGDPTVALDRTEARLETITKLRRKYGEDIPAILAFRAEAAARLSSLENSDEEQARLLALAEEQFAAVRRLADALHVKRQKTAQELSKAALAELAFLDMPAVRFTIEVCAGENYTATGNDTVSFLIATNPGTPLQPLSQIASGGELARIMLALRSVLNERDGVLTAIFDEVDTGISGKTSRKIGIKLSEIARGTQVLCVTHSAQIASLADTHYKIVKTTTAESASSTVIRLDGEDRVAEVARILGGLQVTDAQREAARDMIREGRGEA